MDDADWIAARKALSLARTDLNNWVLTAPYDELPPKLLKLRRRYDDQLRYVQLLQKQRAP